MLVVLLLIANINSIYYNRLYASSFDLFLPNNYLFCAQQLPNKFG